MTALQASIWRDHSAWAKGTLAAVCALGTLVLAEAVRPYSVPGAELTLLSAVLAVSWVCGAGYGAAVLATFTAVLAYLQASTLLLLIPAGVCLVFLTERLTEIQSRLGHAERRQRNMAELIPFGGWTADSEGNMLSLSESFLNAFHVSLSECKGLGWLKFIEEDQRQQVLADWRNCMRSGYFWDYEYQMKSPSGQIFTVLSRGVPIRGSGSSWVGIHLDITERERSAEQRLKQSKELARFNAELEQLAYVSSHDLQEPLRMIASYLQLLQRRYHDNLDEDANTFIGYAVDGADRLRTLLQDLMLLQQVGKSTRRPHRCDLAKITEDALQRLAPQISESGARITYKELPELNCDPPEILRLLINLIENAIKYRRPDIASQIHLSAERRGSEWLISLKDNGIGIDAEYLERVFRIFQRLHARSDYPGTGIGLAICRKIVEVHGGRIWAESTQGEGSTFRFTLPA